MINLKKGDRVHLHSKRGIYTVDLIFLDDRRVRLVTKTRTLIVPFDDIKCFAGLPSCGISEIPQKQIVKIYVEKIPDTQLECPFFDRYKSLCTLHSMSVCTLNYAEPKCDFLRVIPSASQLEW